MKNIKVEKEYSGKFRVYNEVVLHYKVMTESLPVKTDNEPPNNIISLIEDTPNEYVSNVTKIRFWIQTLF